jgi:hypothetical protein
MFSIMSRAAVTPGEMLQLGFTILSFMALMAVISYWVARWRGSDPIYRSGLMLTALCPNNGNFGLPLIAFAFGDDVLTRAVIIFITVSLWNSSAGVVIASSGRSTPRQALMNVLGVPAIYGAVGGLIVNLAGWTVPLVAMRPIEMMERGSIPVMLILLGLQLARVSQVQHLKLIGVGVGLRLLLSPLLATALVLLIGLQAPASTAIIMQTSMPVAVVTIIFSSEFGLDDQFASSAVMASTLLSPITLSILIFLLQHTI